MTYIKTGGIRGPKPKTDWGLVDWNKQDVVIAKDVGCSRERVRQQRIKRGATVLPLHGSRRTPTVDVIRSMDTENMTAKEISDKTNIRKSSVYRILEMLGKNYKRGLPGRESKYDWGSVDWKDRNCDIAVRLGVKNECVVAVYRNRYLKRLEKKNALLVKTETSTVTPETFTESPVSTTLPEASLETLQTNQEVPT